VDKPTLPVTAVYALLTLVALAIFGVGLFLAVGAAHQWTMLAAGCVCLIAVGASWPVAQSLAAARVVMEVGTHSAWVQDVVVGCGHEVLVANPRQMEGPKKRKRKNDRIDANKLARLGRVDPESLYPIQHRSREVRQDLVVLRAREALVAARTELINATRGLVKSMGTRLPKCSSPSFAEKVEGTVPAGLRDALLPLVRMAAALSDGIREYDKKIEKLGQEKYGHTALLRQVKGVGPITSLAYVLTLGNPDRFGRVEMWGHIWD